MSEPTLCGLLLADRRGMATVLSRIRPAVEATGTFARATVSEPPVTLGGSSCWEDGPTSESEDPLTDFYREWEAIGVGHHVDVDGQCAGVEAELGGVETVGVGLGDEQLDELRLVAGDGVDVVGEPVDALDANVDGEASDERPCRLVREACECIDECGDAPAATSST